MNWARARSQVILIMGLLLLTFRPSPASAGGADSLMALLPASNGTGRADVLNELAGLLRSDESARSQAYSEMALRLSDSLNYTPGKADAWFNLGYISWNHADHDVSIERFAKALEYYTAEQDSEGMQEALNGLGLNYDATGQAALAINHYREALAINESIGNQKGLSATYNNIGMMYFYQGDDSLAVDYFKKCLHLDSLVNDLEGMGTSLSNIGMLYDKMGQSELAIDHLKRSLEIRRKLNSPSQVAKTLNNLGSVYSSLGRKKEAEKRYLEALEIKRDLQNDHEVAITLNNIGGFYLEWKKLPEAKAYLEEAKTILDTLPASDNLVLNLNSLAKCYAATGNFELAYSLKSQASILADSLMGERMMRERTSMMAQYETERKERQLEQYRLEMAENKLQTSRFYLAIALLIAGFVLLMTAALIVFVGYRRKAKSNQELKRLNEDIANKNREIEAQKNLLESQNRQIKEINSNLELLVEERTSDLVAANLELDTIFYESSHALRRPLLRIVALFDLIRKEKDPAVVEELNQKVELTVRNMNNTFRKLVEVNEINRRIPQADQIRLEPVVRSLLSELADQHPTEQVDISVVAPDGDLIVTDRYIFTAIMRCLLDNALHFHRINQGVKHKIVISLNREAHHMSLSIHDNGIGIPERLQEDIFQMFYRGTERSNGSGLGLFVVKKGIERLNGSLKVVSRENEFTEIILRLPMPA